MATHTSSEPPATPRNWSADPAAPPPPEVTALVPTVDGAGGRSRPRLGLRVGLAGPWRTDAELLAVILDRPSDPRPTATLVGPDLDPGRGSGLAARHFPRAMVVFPDIDGRHTVVGHQVTFDATARGWWTDLELAPVFGYRPVLRLTLARYRPDSVAGPVLSGFVTTEPVQL